MPHTALPDGWRLIGHTRMSGGCLDITIDYRDEATYHVVWHASDYITMSGSTPDGKMLATDPIVIMLAMMIAVERHLSPNFSLAAWHPPFEM